MCSNDCAFLEMFSFHGFISEYLGEKIIYLELNKVEKIFHIHFENKTLFDSLHFYRDNSYSFLPNIVFKYSFLLKIIIY